MDREVFIEKVMRGEEVALDEVVKNQTLDELNSIKTEAARRIEEERRRTADIELRESRIVELIELSREATKICADGEELERQKNEVLREFAARELENRAKYERVYSKFSGIFHSLSGEAYDRRRVSNPVFKELEGRGAILDQVDFEITRVPLSPMAKQIADERYRGKF